MQLLGLLEGQIIGSLAILIFFGIIMEKRYVSWWSVGGNVIGLILTFATLDLDLFVIIALSGYVVAGLICAKKRWRKVYVLFGSKTYGSALLVLGLFSINGAYSWVNNSLMALGVPSIPIIVMFLIFWAIISGIVFIIGYFVRKKIDDRLNS
ncbi:MAG: hypothetical protein NWF01_08800 [Candidatus Bathyarchaeota archaeon]|nr:hypothetical protein [Candidatus Bathyarchaeota archaeon]